MEPNQINSDKKKIVYLGMTNRSIYGAKIRNNTK